MATPQQLHLRVGQVVPTRDESIGPRAAGLNLFYSGSIGVRLRKERVTPPEEGRVRLRALRRDGCIPSASRMTLRALLFTDVVDSTRRAERLGDARAAEVRAEHDGRARDLLADHRGCEIGRADGLFLLFDDPERAARYALGYRRALADLGLTARAGLHVGPVTLRENTIRDVARGAIKTQVEGLAVPVAARVTALARGGQTPLTPVARDALGGVLPDNARIESPGYCRLKGLDEPVEVFELGARDCSAFSPPFDVDKAYRVVRTGDFWRPVREGRHNLPAERDAFVGRAAERRTLAARLDTGSRLVAVSGPGGTRRLRSAAGSPGRLKRPSSLPVASGSAWRARRSFPSSRCRWRWTRSNSSRSVPARRSRTSPSSGIVHWPSGDFAKVRFRREIAIERGR